MGHGFDLHQIAQITRPPIFPSSHSLSPSTALISNPVTLNAATNRIGWDPETSKTIRKEQCRFVIFNVNYYKKLFQVNVTSNKALSFPILFQSHRQS